MIFLSLAICMCGQTDVDAVMRGLKSPIDESRLIASERLLQLPSRAIDKLIPEIADSLLDKSNRVRHNIALTLRQAERSAIPAIPKILKAIFAESDTDVVSVLQDTLIKLGQPVIPQVKEILSNASVSSNSKYIGLSLLGKFVAFEKEAVKAIEPYLKDEDLNIAIFSAHQIIELDKTNNKAIQFLSATLASEKPSLAQQGRVAGILLRTKLKHQTAEFYTKAFVRAAKGEALPEIGVQSLDALWAIGPPAADAASQSLENQLSVQKNRNPYVAATLLKVQPYNGKALNYFSEAPEDFVSIIYYNSSKTNSYNENYAFELAKLLRPVSSKIGPALQKTLKQEACEQMRNRIRSILQTIESKE
jgi:hypothetical protein